MLPGAEVLPVLQARAGLRLLQHPDRPRATTTGAAAADRATSSKTAIADVHRPPGRASPRNWTSSGTVRCDCPHRRRPPPHRPGPRAGRASTTSVTDDRLLDRPRGPRALPVRPSPSPSSCWATSPTLAERLGARRRRPRTPGASTGSASCWPSSTGSTTTGSTRSRRSSASWKTVRRERAVRLARLLAWLLPRGSGRHVTLPGPEAPDPDATVIFPRIPDDGIPPSTDDAARPAAGQGLGPYYDPEDDLVSGTDLDYDDDYDDEPCYHDHDDECFGPNARLVLHQRPRRRCNCRGSARLPDLRQRPRDRGTTGTPRRDRRPRRPRPAAAVLAVAAVAGGSPPTSVLARGDAGHPPGDRRSATCTRLSIDGIIVAASMVLLHAARHGEGAPWLAWSLLGAGIGVTLAANVTYGARSGLSGRAVGAGPRSASSARYELLMLLVRASARRAGTPVIRRPPDRRRNAARGMRCAPPSRPGIPYQQQTSSPSQAVRVDPRSRLTQACAEHRRPHDMNGHAPSARSESSGRPGCHAWTAGTRAGAPTRRRCPSWPTTRPATRRTRQSPRCATSLDAAIEVAERIYGVPDGRRRGARGRDPRPGRPGRLRAFRWRPASAARSCAISRWCGASCPATRSTASTAPNATWTRRADKVLHPTGRAHPWHWLPRRRPRAHPHRVRGARAAGARRAHLRDRAATLSLLGLAAAARLRGVADFGGIRSWQHYRTWERPAAPCPHARARRPARPPGHRTATARPCPLQLPETFIGEDRDQRVHRPRRTTKLALEAPDVDWQAPRQAPVVTFTRSQPPPSRVSWADVEAAIARRRPGTS